jgi:Lar family restriction alleviation protein
MIHVMSRIPTSLLPCPFCGGTHLKISSLDRQETIGGITFIECTHCGSTGPYTSAGHDAARKFWNHRASTPTPGLSRKDRQDFFESSAPVTLMPLALPCPFCGHSDIVMDDRDHGPLICELCDAAGPAAPNPVETLALWNGRPS